MWGSQSSGVNLICEERDEEECVRALFFIPLHFQQQYYYNIYIVYIVYIYIVFTIIEGTLNILLTKTTAALNEVALSYYKVRGLYFVAVVFVRSVGSAVKFIKARITQHLFYYCEHDVNVICKNDVFLFWRSTSVIYLKQFRPKQSPLISQGSTYKHMYYTTFIVCCISITIQAQFSKGTRRRITF